MPTDIHGSCLSLPFRADARGALAVVSGAKGINEEAILTLLQTRQGERVMMPDYGLPDLLFSTRRGDFARRLAVYLNEQVRKYVPGVEGVGVAEVAGADGDEHSAHLQITWAERGSNVAHNLVFPMRQLREL